MISQVLCFLFPQTSYALYICPQQLITTTFLLLIIFFFILLFYPSNKDEEVRFLIMIYEICWGSRSFDTYLLWVYPIIIGLWKNRNWKIYKKQSHKQHKNSCSLVLGLCLQATLPKGLCYVPDKVGTAKPRGWYNWSHAAEVTKLLRIQISAMFIFC